MAESRKRIFYLDDEPINLQLFQLTFQKEYDVTTAETPEEALGKLAVVAFDVIISDMKMPAMSGVEFLTQAQALRPATARVLVTGLLEDDEIEAARARGVVNFIVHKPWLKSELLEVLEEAARR